METGVVRHIAAIDPTLPVAIPRPARDGTPWGTIAGADGARHVVRLLPLLPGRHGTATELSREAIRDFGSVSARLGRATRGYFHPLAGRPILWDVKHLADLRPHLPLVTDERRRALVETILDRFERAVAPSLRSFRAQVIHNDLTFDNTLLDPTDRVSGIVDFGDMAHTALVLDLVAALVALLGGRDDPADLFAAAEAGIAGYAAITPLEDEEAALLGDLVAARLAQTTLISAWRIGIYPENAAYLSSWDAEAWPMLALFEAVGLPEVRRRFAAAARRIPAWPVPAAPLPILPGGHPTNGDAELLGRRRRVLGAALSALTYERPLHLVRGEGARMYDTEGRPYLDCYNNVPVVGHSHPRVVAAIARQAATLNTNTRYLHETVVELAERLVATMPPGLDTVMFVNSGSEANDLAWRLATSATGGRGGIVTEWAYHGVSAAIADLSPEAWPHGDQPPHVGTIPPPDTYRHPGAGDPDEGAWAEGAAARLDDAVAGLAARGFRPAAVFVDGAFTSDGIFAPPRGLPPRPGPADPRRGRPLRGRRGPGGLRPPGRRPLELRGRRDRARHRDPREADGERPPGRRDDHPFGDRRPLRRGAGVLQHVRRQPGRLRRGHGRPRRRRGRGAHGTRRRGGRGDPGGDPGGGDAPPGDRRRPRAGADDRRGAGPRPGDAGARPGPRGPGPERDARPRRPGRDDGRAGGMSSRFAHRS